MSSNSAPRTTRGPRLLSLLAAASVFASLAGCQSDADHGQPAAALTPTQQYPLQADQRADQILLAPHLSGLSLAQAQALDRVADRWRDAGQGAIVIREPLKAPDPKAVAHTSFAARNRLVALGVPPEQIRREGYDPQGNPRAAVVVAFVVAEALVPSCGRDWENLSSNPQNTTMRNFGCAVSANMAAQIADPADIAAPRASDPPDAVRRATVLGKYQQGQPTGSDDKQSNISVSGIGAGGGD